MKRQPERFKLTEQSAHRALRVYQKMRKDADKLVGSKHDSINFVVAIVARAIKLKLLRRDDL